MSAAKWLHLGLTAPADVSTKRSGFKWVSHLKTKTCILLGVCICACAHTHNLTALNMMRQSQTTVNSNSAKGRGRPRRQKANFIFHGIFFFKDSQQGMERKLVTEECPWLGQPHSHSQMQQGTGVGRGWALGLLLGPSSYHGDLHLKVTSTCPVPCTRTSSISFPSRSARGGSGRWPRAVNMWAAGAWGLRP